METNAAANLDSIDVAPNEGKFLYLLAKLTNGKRVPEIGTLGASSALWFAKSVRPSGSVISLEKDASIARSNTRNAGLGDAVEVRAGKGMETLGEMKPEGRWNGGSGGEFDMVCIDADKGNNVGYLKYAL
jgi:predicted O-methyltransferase YrrM